jgi:hypothetical protein
VRGMSQRALLTIIFAVSVSAFGQQNQKMRDRDPDLAGSKKIIEDIQQANFHFRSFYLSSRIRLSDVGYGEGSSVPTGEQGDGFSLAVEAPQRLYYRPLQKFILSAEVVPSYNFFGNRDTNQFNYTSRADAHFLFNHLYLDVYGVGLDQLRAHVSDINRLATVREKQGGVAGEIKYSSRTSALFNTSYSETSYPRNRYQPILNGGIEIPVQLLDRVTRSGRASLTHKTFPKTTLFVAAEGNNYAFRRATFKDSSRLWYGGGMIWNSGRTQLRAEAGPVRLDFDDPSQADYTGVSGAVGLSRSNGPWGYSLSADRDLGFAITTNNNFFVATTLNGGVTYQATRKLLLRANAIHERDEYDQPSPGTVGDRIDTISFYSVGGSYGLRRLRFGGDVGWYARDSTILPEEDAGIRYLVHLSFTP